MHISFNGVISPFTYNCPYAHKLRNIDKIFKPYEAVETTEESGDSKRMWGIKQHELIAEYIRGITTDEYELTTETIEWVKNQPNIEIESQRWFSTDWEILTEKPSKGTYISSRPDAIVHEEGKLTLLDWKFGNPEYGSTKHYDETEFFLALESAREADVGEWEIRVHFPETDYTLPIRTYNSNKIARIQQKYMTLVDNIVSTKIFVPKPGRLRCKMCDQRSEDAGGTGGCEYTTT